MKWMMHRSLPLVAGVLLTLAAASLHAQDWAKARLDASCMKALPVKHRISFVFLFF
jgi:hypothetical protein